MHSKSARFPDLFKNQDTFKKYLDTDTFLEKYLDTDTFKMKKYLNTDSFKILFGKST